MGQAYSKALKQIGYTVYIADLDKIENEVISKDLGVDFLPIDITSEKSVEDLFNFFTDRKLKIDGIVNNAYPRNKNYGRKFEDVTYTDFCENISLHLGGYFLVCQKAVKFFREQGYGNIINISSIYGVSAPRFEIYDGTNITMPVEYAGIKSAVIHLTKYIAKYCKGENIRCNSLSLGGIFLNQPESFLRKYKEYASNKGMLDPDDVVGSLAFLISDDSKYINGQNIIVDDGWTL